MCDRMGSIKVKKENDRLITWVQHPWRVFSGLYTVTTTLNIQCQHQIRERRGLGLH